MKDFIANLHEKAKKLEEECKNNRFDPAQLIKAQAGVIREFSSIIKAAGKYNLDALDFAALEKKGYDIYSMSPEELRDAVVAIGYADDATDKDWIDRQNQIGESF